MEGVCREVAAEDVVRISACQARSGVADEGAEDGGTGGDDADVDFEAVGWV